MHPLIFMHKRICTSFICQYLCSVSKWRWSGLVFFFNFLTKNSRTCRGESLHAVISYCTISYTNMICNIEKIFLFFRTILWTTDTCHLDHCTMKGTERRNYGVGEKHLLQCKNLRECSLLEFSMRRHWPWWNDHDAETQIRFESEFLFRATWLGVVCSKWCNWRLFLGENFRYFKDISSKVYPYFEGCLSKHKRSQHFWLGGGENHISHTMMSLKFSKRGTFYGAKIL